MIATNHALFGAIVAANIRQPLLAVPLSFASHFFMDALPHFWIQAENGSVRKRNANRLFKVVTRTDATLCILAILAVPFLLRSNNPWLLVAACMIAAVSPDLAWVKRYFQELKTGIISPANRFNRFHKKIQWGEFSWALPIDIIWLVGSLVVLARIK